MSLHLEVEFEDEICDHLSHNGWLYQKDDADNYDRELALYPSDLITWVREAFPESWKKLQKQKGVEAKESLLKRVREQLNQVGTLMFCGKELKSSA